MHGPRVELNRSFRDTLIDKEPDHGLLEVSVESSLHGCLKCQGVGLVGRVCDFRTLTSLRSWLLSVIKEKVDIKYVGGLWVVLVFGDQEIAQEFFRGKQVWESCFDTLENWGGQLIPVERIAWLKIYGVPLCLYDDGVFNVIGSKFGTVIQSANVNEQENDFSHVMIAVLRNSVDKVHQFIKLKWKNDVVSVLVEEEVGEWVPDCLVSYDEDDDFSSGSRDRVETQNVCMRLDSDHDGDHENVSCRLLEGDHEMRRDEGSLAFGGVPIVTEEVQCVKKVFSNHIKGDGISKDVKKKRAKVSRKKTRAKKSVSPVGQERPKKRARDGEDPFDIDRFIFPVNGHAG
ncbi:hypothetical protein HanPI659440_Chr03g0104491 [Helianthus annuus]|nr:hypothetical protein HanPI659440_Chr03g0104491 [Helianthus annuus]